MILVDMNVHMTQLSSENIVSSKRKKNRLIFVSFTLSVVLVAAIVLLVVLLVQFYPRHRDDSAQGLRQYGVMFDAGSSGTRVFVYSWNSTAPADMLYPAIHPEPAFLRIKPGLSTLEGANQSSVDAYLADLIEFAHSRVPADQRGDTPVFLKATAGLRLLSAQAQTQLMSQVQETFVTRSEFFVPPGAAQVISGSYEGAFMWLAVNTALGILRRSTNTTATVGSVECGGASAQMSFIPGAISLSNETYPSSSNASVFAPDLFAGSWLRYGVNEARYRLYDLLAAAANDSTTIVDPCLPLGLTHDSSHSGIVAVGASNASACLAIMVTLLNTSAPCAYAHCAMAGQYVPRSWPASNTFVAADNYLKVLAYLHLKPGIVAPSAIRTAALALCALDAAETRAWLDGVDGADEDTACSDAMWTSALLIEGMGLDAPGVRVVFQQVINGYQTSWTLGAMFVEGSVYVPTPARTSSLHGHHALGRASYLAAVGLAGALIVVVVLAAAVFVAMKARRGACSGRSNANAAEDKNIGVALLRSA